MPRDHQLIKGLTWIQHFYARGNHANRWKSKIHNCPEIEQNTSRHFLKLFRQILPFNRFVLNCSSRFGWQYKLLLTFFLTWFYIQQKVVVTKFRIGWIFVPPYYSIVFTKSISASEESSPAKYHHLRLIFYHYQYSFVLPTFILKLWFRLKDSHSKPPV